MGSHDSFEYLKHKLWPKEGLGVKVQIWLMTTKSQEAPWNTCVKVACYVFLESSWQGLQLCFRLHLIWTSSQEVMAFQNVKSHNFGNFETLTWESRDKMTFGCSPMVNYKKYYKGEGKVVVSFKFGPWWFLWIRVCPWFVCAPKVLQPCINQLVVWVV
jgi:hypothetical protein